MEVAAQFQSGGCVSFCNQDNADIETPFARFFLCFCFFAYCFLCVFVAVLLSFRSETQGQHKRGARLGFQKSAVYSSLEDGRSNRAHEALQTPPWPSGMSCNPEGQPRCETITFCVRHNQTRNITSHSMKNLGFHSSLRWKMIILPILTTSLIHWEIVLFWAWKWKLKEQCIEAKTGPRLSLLLLVRTNSIFPLFNGFHVCMSTENACLRNKIRGWGRGGGGGGGGDKIRCDTGVLLSRALQYSLCLG